MASISIDEIRDAAGLVALAEDWQVLHGACADAGLFTTHVWVQTWWQHLGARRRLRVLVLREGATVRGILPLCLRRLGPAGSPFWKLEFLGTGQNDWTDFLIPTPDDRIWNLVADYLLRLRPRWSVLDLRQWPETSPHRVGLERALVSRGCVVRAAEDEHCPAIRLEGTWDEFLQRQFSGKSRWQLRKKAKAAAARGTVAIRYVTEPEEMAGTLDAVERIQAREEYGGRPRIGIFDKPATRAFYREAAQQLAARGWMQLALLTIDDRLVAYRYGFRFGGRHYDYFHDYEAAFADASPGMVLMQDLIARCFGEGLQEFNFLRGDEGYKAQWCTHVDRHVRFMAFPPTLAGRLAQRVYATRGKEGGGSESPAPP